MNHDEIESHSARTNKGFALRSSAMIDRGRHIMDGSSTTTHAPALPFESISPSGGQSVERPAEMGGRRAASRATSDERRDTAVHRGVEQWLARVAHNHQVGGSNPPAANHQSSIINVITPPPKRALDASRPLFASSRPVRSLASSPSAPDRPFFETPWDCVETVVGHDRGHGGPRPGRHGSGTGVRASCEIIA